MHTKQKAKEINFKGKELQEKVKSTLEALDKIVGATLGPGGNPILLERVGLSPLITKDGVTVADSISFEDATQYVIAEAAKEACQKTNKEAGDGTTTAVVLANALVNEGTKYLENNVSKSPQELCREFDKIVKVITDKLKDMAIPVKEEDLKKVALVSSNFDEDIAEAVVEAILMVGDDGTIVTEESSGRETLVEERDGFPINKGLSGFGAAQELFMNNPQDQECAYELPYVLLYDGDLLSPPEVGTFLSACFEEMKKDGNLRPVIIIAHKFSPHVLKMFAHNVQMNTALICPLETSATAQPNSKHHLLHDLAAFLDAEVLDPITNTFNAAMQTKRPLDFLGACEKSRIGRYKSILLESGSPEKVEERIKILKTQKDNAESDYDAEIIKERISMLAGGIATIYVGGSSELEIREKKHRIEDTINATKSAIEMGVIAGGGATLLWMSDYLLKNAGQSIELPVSAAIIGSALSVPFCRIMTNAGHNEQDITKAAEEVVNSECGNVYDSLTHQYVNPIDAGILDPVKVSISALVNAVSIAKMLMTIGGAVVIPRDKAEERQSELQTQALAQQMQGV